MDIHAAQRRRCAASTGASPVRVGTSGLLGKLQLTFDGIDSNSKDSPKRQTNNHDKPAIWVQLSATKEAAQDVTGAFNQKLENDLNDQAADQPQHATRHLSDDVSNHSDLMNLSSPTFALRGALL